ncbi:MAG: glutathione peroxidase [Gammaproteobacteria bacterium]
MNIYNFQFNKLDGTPLNLADYRGKPILLVNTASKCGFTPQYKELQELWDKYRDKGLVVVGVPSNDFANQEPGNSGEIACFVKDHFAVSFPITDKNKVTGTDAHPCYQAIAKQVGWLGKPHWNFYKYLFNKNGELVEWFSSITKPNAKKVIKAVEQELK